MNVTEKQKRVLLDFMKKHPDMGRGRLRWNSENKRKLEKLWDELTLKLNYVGCGPQKRSKDWAKTWRDWKSNVLKKVAAHKGYTSGTGERPPQLLKTTQLEDDLLEFLTPYATVLSGVPEGGLGDEFITVVPSSSMWESVDDDRVMKILEYKECSKDPTNLHSSCSNISINPSMSEQTILLQPHSSATMQPDVHSVASFEGKTTFLKRKRTEEPEITASEHRPYGRKCIPKSVVRFLEDKTMSSDKYKKRMIELKEEKLRLYKGELAEKRQHRQEVLDRLDDIKTAIKEMNDIVKENLEGQYLT